MGTPDRISELYHGHAKNHFSAATEELARERIQWMCSRVKGQRVIDVGCSQGIVGVLLARQGFTVLGVDTDERAIQYAQSDRAKESPEVMQRLSFLQGDIFELDLPNRAYNTVLMGEFLEHQSQPEKGIAKAFELLANAGTLVITVPRGVFRHPDHRQTFYAGSLYRLVLPHFDVSEVVLIGRYVCMTCRKRAAFLKQVPMSIDIALLERFEREFEERENELLDTIANARKRIQTMRNSLSFQLGHAFLEALRKPGRSSILLAIRLLTAAVARVLRRQVGDSEEGKSVVLKNL